MYKDVLNNFCNAKGNPLPKHTHTFFFQKNIPSFHKQINFFLITDPFDKLKKERENVNTYFCKWI